MKALFLILALVSVSAFAKTYTIILIDPKFPDKPFRAQITGKTGIRNFERYLEKGQVTLDEQGNPNIGILSGPIARNELTPGHQWDFHFVPKELDVAEVSPALCNGSLPYVEQYLDYFLNTVGRFCPWGTRVVTDEIYRDDLLLFKR
jgi:hypothetical protein